LIMNTIFFIFIFFAIWNDAHEQKFPSKPHAISR
jgi:hypothetical protein